MNKSESITKIAPALIKFNKEVTRIAKDADNPFHKNKYATLDTIIESVRPVLAENGLSVMQNVTSQEDGRMTVNTFLFHESGEWMESQGTTLKLAKNDPQGAGAGVTYARRYDLCAFLSLNTGEDDDGNSASGVNNKKPQQQKPSKQPTQEQIDIQSKIAELMKQSETDKGGAIELLGYTNKQFSDLYNGSQKKQKELISTLEGKLNDYQHAG